MTPDDLNAAPASPASGSLADHAAPHPIHGDQVHGPLDEGRVSFHDQLAALIDALASETEHQPRSEVEAPQDDFVLPMGLQQSQSDLPGSDHKHQRAEPEPERVPLVTVRNMLTHRAFGVAIGLIASVAVGGVMLVVGSGMSDPPAIAGHSAANDEARVADVTGPPDAAAARPQSRLPQAAEVGPELAADADEERDGSAKLDIEQVAFADANTAAPTALPQPGHGVSPERDEAAAPSTQDTAGAIPPSADQERADSPLKQLSSGLATRFETTVKAELRERESLPASVAARAAADHDGDTAARLAQVIRAVNMRAGPSNDEVVLAVVSEGSSVEVVHCNHWCEVKFDGHRGWIYQSFISLTDADAVFVQ